MRHFLSFALQSAVAGLIIIQRDADGAALVTGYHGLALAFGIALAGMIWSLCGAARVTLTVED